MASLGSFVRTTQGQTPGTLQSSGLFHQPNVPNQSQAQGIQGADGRAYTRNVQGNELVSNQLTNLLDNPNSAYIKQARQQGLAQAASRGLGNSSIAAGSAQREAIKAGLPIASQDASTYSAAQSQNMDALNQNLMQERQISNEMLKAERDLEAAYAAQDAQLQAAAEDRMMRLQLQRENLAYEGEQRGLDRGFQNYMEGLGYQRDLGRMSADYNFRDSLANNDAFRQEWLSSNDFDRNFYRDIALNFQGAQLQNSSDFYSRLSQAIFDNPEVFGNPDYASGLNNFFQSEIFDNYFDDLMSGIGG